ncbi:MAG: MmcQ/YjbR family DNA-binding protein [Opitutales bacterium]|jgi:predicted DNA-binding protein (MmcQ/YjbR family)|nr:MmcQ/YjbR family DNA-binding protein [Opitutales bacterium]
MYALSAYETPLTVNLKCDPDRSLKLRRQYDSVQPGYHMNKRHWNTLTLDGSLPHSLIIELIQHSYDLVVLGLSKKEQIKVKEASTKPRKQENDWHAQFLKDISE